MVDAGMGGVVLKSHFYPTPITARFYQEKFPDFNIIGSITLNASAGGCNVWAVEAAHSLGAKVAYMPTWSAKNDLHKKSISHVIGNYVPHLSDFTEEDGTYIMDETGAVAKKYLDILDFMKEKDMTLFTGHISPEECIALAKAAKEMGFKKLVMQHPDSGSVKATFEQVKEIAALGAYIEICALGLTPIYYRITPPMFEQMIHTVGADKCVMTTDYFFEWSAPIPEQMRLLAASLMSAGVEDEEITAMARYNPERLLGL